MECLLSRGCSVHLSDRDGEGFRTPARAGRASRAGPASESRPCTNPRAASAALWGFEDSGAGAEVARPRQPTAVARQRRAWMGFKSVDHAMPCREMVRLWRHGRGGAAFGGSGGATARSSKQRDFDEKLRLAVPGHDATIPAGRRRRGGARARVAGSRISMTTMRPPQHGHGGLGSEGASGAAGPAVAGTARSSRARATLALRPALASRP